MLKRVLGGVLAITVWLANPMLACSGAGAGDGEGDFTFGESEMRAAVKGTYIGQLPTTSETITLTLDEATVAPSGTTTTQSTKRVQCGNRTFIQSASACISFTVMPLHGTISSSGTTIASGTLKAGSFESMGRLLDGAALSLTLPDGAKLTASYVASEDALLGWLLTTADGQAQKLELVRSK